MRFDPPRSIALGRYEIGQALVSDELGDAWRARDVRSGTDVVVKFLAWGAGRAPPGRATYASEVRALLERPLDGGVTVSDIAIEGRHLYLVAQAADHVGLDAVIEANGVLGPGDAAAALDAILATLSEAHARGLVLKDLSPQSVLFAPDASARVSWFGALTQPSARPGLQAALFRAPEQTDALVTPDRRWDIYAAGQLLHAMLTGGALQDSVTDEDLERTLGPVLTPIFRKATAMPPSARYVSADQMRVAINEVRALLTASNPLFGMKLPLEAPKAPEKPAPDLRRLLELGLWIAAGVAVLVLVAMLVSRI